MRRFRTTIVLALATLLSVSICSAQQASTTAVPGLIRYSGTLKDTQGAALSSSTAVGVTFAIYKQQDGGAAVWMETQNVTPDSNGQYNVILGSSTVTGLPDDLFSQQEQRWLGVQIQGEAEQDRVLLVSVPYAFKAHEAETLGGLPASAFVKAPPSDASGSGSTGVNSGISVNALSAVGNTRSVSRTKGTAASAKANICNSVTSGTGGPSNVIPMWGTLGCDLLNSLMFQDPAATVVNDNGSFNLVFTSPFSSPSYQIGGSSVLSISGLSAPFTTLSVGMDAGSGGQSNTFSGTGAGHFNFFGMGNTFTGAFAGYNNSGGFFGPTANTFTGAYAGQTSVGSNNVFSGYQAGGNSNGSNNTFSGYGSGFNNKANGNSFHGYQAGFSNTSTGNAFFGYQAGYSNTRPDPHFGLIAGNSFYGYQAGYSNTTGRDNTFNGYQAGYLNTTGVDNTFIGSNAARGLQAGDNNIFIGAYSTVPAPVSNNVICLSCQRAENLGSDEIDNMILIGSHDVEYTTLIQGISNDIRAGGDAVYVESDGTLHIHSSSSRFKEQIHKMGESSGRLFELRPVTFFYKPQYDNGARLLQYGLIAEEVAKIYPEMVSYDEYGQPYTVHYEQIAPMLLNELQKQHAVVAAQQDVIKTQEGQIQTQGQQIASVQERLSRLESLIAKSEAH